MHKDLRESNLFLSCYPVEKVTAEAVLNEPKPHSTGSGQALSKVEGAVEGPSRARGPRGFGFTTKNTESHEACP